MRSALSWCCAFVMLTDTIHASSIPHIDGLPVLNHQDQYLRTGSEARLGFTSSLVL